MKSDANTSKDDLDLLGDDDESFTGSHADLEGAADTLFSSPPRPQPLRFEVISLKTPHNVPPTPGTVLQNKIENRLEKSLGNTFNIQLKQEMGLFQASMLDAMKSLRKKLLFKIKSHDDGKCSFCKQYSETILHLFVQCKDVKNFWSELKTHLQLILGIDLAINPSTIILGNLLTKTIVIPLNTIYLAAK